ncbi:high-affinity iron transporter [Rhizobium sp. BK619]|uniref:FTR1 family iron permease n=1 Tax=Rhizobium sp. BK619 TaxID=2586989 RepID=UPI001616C198|nr:FTR1 family protein [Rhizobium sp. BK619]MBB3648265.1 high-affinity iron transporter [Rhizobium sp. BK619]
MSSNLYLQFVEVAAVVWRESFEALLIVGILLTWSMRDVPAARGRAAICIASGVVGGLVFAAILACIMNTAADVLEGDAEEILQMVMASVAAFLMLRMVFWMRRQERGSSNELQTRAIAHVRAGNWLGLSMLAGLAVAREGAETVVFLAGVMSSSTDSETGLVLASGLSGFALAATCFWAFKVGATKASKKVLARFSQGLLLVLGSGLTMVVIDRAISLGFVSPMTVPLWDSSSLLDDGSGFGAFIAGLTGYRSRPELLPILGIAFYWLVASVAYAPPLDDEVPA